MNASQIVDDISNLQKCLELLPGEDQHSLEAHHNATLFFMCHMRSLLASKRVLHEHKLSHEAWTWLLDRIKADFQQALVAPGEMVGTVAAQSIGEPTTQMCLNT